MPLSIGLTEVQQHMVLSKLRVGASYEEATQFLVCTVEPAAIERNREYLTSKAEEQLEALKPPKTTIATKR